MTDDEVCTRIDDGVREPDDIAPVAAEVALVAGRDVLTVGALGASVHRDDDDVGRPRRAAHEPLRGADVRERRRPLVRGEADERHVDRAHGLHADLAAPARMSDADRGEGVDRLPETCLAEVVRVVVREADDGEAGVREPRGVRRWDAEGAALGTPRRARRHPALGERPLEVPQHDVARKIRLDVGEERATPVGRHVGHRAERDVAGRGDRDRHGRRRGGRHLPDDRRRRRLRDRRDSATIGHRLLRAAHEERDDHSAHGDDSACTHDQRDDPHGAPL